jgi:hypothetical protein
MRPLSCQSLAATLSMAASDEGDGIPATASTVSAPGRVRKMRRNIIPMALGLLLGLVLAACGGNTSGTGDQAGTPAMSTDRAQTIAHNMLVAYNSGDYQAFSQDWSSPMKLVVRERAFQKFRDENLPTTGPFKAISSVTPVAGQQDADHASYQVHARFQKREGVLFTITLSADHATVEGLEFNSQS